MHTFAIRRPYLVLGLAALVTLAFVPGLFRLHLRTDGHALVPAVAPAVLLDEAVRSEFGVRDPLVILVHSHHSDGIYNARTLHLVDELTRAFRDLSGIDSASVRSLATEPSDHFRPGSLTRRLLLEPVPETRGQLDALRDDVEAIGLLTGTLISHDGASAAILAGVRPDANRTALVYAARQVIANSNVAGHDVSVLGAPAAEALLGVHILEDLGVSVGQPEPLPEAFAETPPVTLSVISRLRLAIARHLGLLPLSILVMALVFYICFGSVTAALLPLLEAGACLVFVFGLMGWTGVPVYLTMAVLPVILVSMGLVDEIHVFTSYRQRRAAVPNESTAEAVNAALDETCLPVLATGFTTFVGFLAFALSPLEPVRAFGIFTAIGIAFCTLWTLTVVPALLVLTPWSAFRGGRPLFPIGATRVSAWIVAIERFGRRPALPLSIAFVALLLSPLAIQRVVVQDSWINGFARESAFFRATEFFNRHFLGMHRLLLAVDTGHVDLKGPLPAGDLSFDEIRLPAGIVSDPAMLLGCSLRVTVRADSGAAPSSAFRPQFWSSNVEGAEKVGDRLVITSPVVHGSAKFLFQPAPAETLDYELHSQGLANPSVLRRLDALERFVREQEEDAVGGVVGPPDHIAAAEFLVSDRARGSRVIPSEVDRVRWLWTSMGQVIGTERLREVVDPQLEHGLITVFLRDANYVDTARLMASLREYEREHLTPERIRFDFAGDVAVSQTLIEAIVRSQVGSLVASLLGIAAVIAILFRSFRWGLICMFPAALAVAATFAAMGMTGTPLGVATSMFASMVLGTGVDFAVHLVERYRVKKRGGASHDVAIHESLVATGPAIVANALAIALGFGILTLSRVPANAHLGMITVVSLTACLAATFLVIPALLRVAAPGPRTGP